MGRKNANAVKSTARPRQKFRIPKGMHFIYSTDEFGADPTVVRYLGEQEDDRLFVFHPEGYTFWAHVHHLNLPLKRNAA